MDLKNFMAIATMETTDKQSANNPNTTIASKVFTKTINGIDLRHTREVLINNGKVISRRQKFQVNDIGVSKREFLRHLI